MGQLGSVQVLGQLCSVVRNKLIAIWIGPVGVGLVILFNSVSDLVGVFTRLNIDQSSQRDIASAGDADTTAKLSYVTRRWSVWLGLLAWLLMCAFSPLLSKWSFGDTSRWPDFCLLGAVPFLTAVALGYQAVMKGCRQFGLLARVSALIAIGGIMVSVPLIWFLRERAIIWIILSYALCLFVGSWLWRVRLPRVRMKFREVWSTGMSFVRLGFFITLGLGAGYLANYLFVLYMNNYADTTRLGLYQAGYIILNSYVGAIFNGVWTEYFPRLSCAIRSRRATEVTVSHRISMTAWTLLPVMTLFMALDEPIVRIIYSSSFLDIIPYITLGMSAMGLRAASWCIQHTVLARGDGRLYVVTEIASCTLCLVLNIVGYSQWGFVGLGVSYIIWYLSFLALVWYIYRRHYGYRLRGRVMVPVLAGAVVAIGAAVGRLLLGWWLPLAVTLIVLPIAYKKLSK